MAVAAAAAAVDDYDEPSQSQAKERKRRERKRQHEASATTASAAFDTATIISSDCSSGLCVPTGKSSINFISAATAAAAETAALPELLNQSQAQCLCTSRTLGLSVHSLSSTVLYTHIGSTLSLFSNHFDYFLH